MDQGIFAAAVPMTWAGMSLYDALKTLLAYEQHWWDELEAKQFVQLVETNRANGRYQVVAPLPAMPNE